MKSCAGVRFNSTTDITLFTMETPKLLLKQNIIMSVCLQQHLSKILLATVMIEQKEKMEAKGQI